MCYNIFEEILKNIKYKLEEYEESKRKSSKYIWKKALLDPSSRQLTSDPKICCKIFANEFQDRVKRLLEKVPEKNAMLDTISKRFSDNDLDPPQFDIQTIIVAIKNMGPSDSLGPDGIELWLIKAAAEQLAPILKNIYDKVALNGKMPQQWKTAKIFGKIKEGIEVHVSKKSTDPKDYRPISLLCWIGKIFEKCLSCMIKETCGSSLTSDFQYAYKEKCTYTGAVEKIKDYISDGLKMEKKIILVATDLSSAFDLVDKDILIPRMLKMGLSKSICDIYMDFLSDRKGFVECGEAKTEEYSIPLGCVQGSPSGNLLFTLHVDGIADYLSDVNMVGYADDMFYVYEAETWDEVAKVASINTERAKEWFSKSGMVLNMKKMRAACFDKSLPEELPVINVGGDTILCKDSMTILGIAIDQSAFL